MKKVKNGEKKLFIKNYPIILLRIKLINVIYKENDKNFTNVLLITITICISIGIIWFGNTIFYKLFDNKAAQEYQLKQKIKF